MSDTPEAAPVALFYSYAHEDEALRDELQGHLKILERRGLLAPWHDRQIQAGQAWNAAIDENLKRAELVLLLVSKDFIDSDYIFGTELEAAKARHDTAASVVVPILVRAVDIEPEDFWFMQLQGLPVDLKPVTSWPNRDEAWTNVAKGLRATVKDIRARRTAPASAEPPAAAASSPPTPPPFAAPSLPWDDGGAPAGGPAESVESGGAPAAADPFAPFEAPRTIIRPTPRAREAAPSLDAMFGAAPAAATDPVLQGVVDGVVAQVEAAQLQRGQPMDAAARQAVRDRTAALIDVPDQKRVLWVDDRPDNNRLEAAALAKLQIDVVTATSTDDALRLLQAETEEPFDLVISDWERRGEAPAATAAQGQAEHLYARHLGLPPDAAETAGPRLLIAMRLAGFTTPIVYYHGEAGAARRAARAGLVKTAGAVGEAIRPDQLMALVLKVLSDGGHPIQPD